MPYGVEHPSGVVFVSRARVQERPELYGRGGEEAVRRLDFGALPDRLPVFMDEELQVEIDANSRLVVAIGLPLPGSRNDCRAFTESGGPVSLRMSWALFAKAVDCPGQERLGHREAERPRQ